MIDLDVISNISVDKIAPKLDLGSFTNEQNSFAKVFETASKSFEATKKSLDNTDNKKYENASKSITADKQVNNNNKQKEKISKDKPNRKDNKNTLNKDNQKTPEKTNIEEKQINNETNKSKIADKETEYENKNTQQDSAETNITDEVTNVSVEAILNDIQNLEVIENTAKGENIIPEQAGNTSGKEEIVLLQKIEGLNKLVSVNAAEQVYENKNEPTTEQLTAKIDLRNPELLQKTNNTSAEAEVQTQKEKEPGFLEKLLFGKRQESHESNLTQQNAQESRETSEKLLNEKVQSSDLTQKVIEELRVNDNKLLTQNPIQTLSAKDNIFKQNNEFLIKHNNSLNLVNLLNQNLKSETETSLSDVMAELDIDTDIQIDVTSTSLNNQTSEHHNEFNFNSSAFTDLNSHVTKLSLNKTADFSKVMNTKNVQQDNQILNQVKEATSNNLNKGTTSVSIILKPESLGRVHINLVSQNGVLTAQLTAQTQQTADVLSRNIETLRQNLIDQGVKIAEVSVKVQETSSSDGLLSNDSNSFEDKLGQTKEQYQSKHNHKNQYGNTLDEENNYIHNNLNNDEADETALSADTEINNNDLGIYNNMGRTL